MTVKLNQHAYEHAKRLIEDGQFIDHERDAWSDHHPSTRSENEFIEKERVFEYSKWFLAANDEYRKDSRRHYEFPYGDFKNVHCCGLLAALSRAGQDKYVEIENAVADLLTVIDKQARKRSPVKVYAYGPRMKETFNLQWRSDDDARGTLVQSTSAGRYLLRGSRGPHGICRRTISGC